jgi:3-oxoacyl-[acyl-carrier-protein] synthase III
MSRPATIEAMHYCVPSKVLGHDELVERFGNRAIVAIEKMSGIKERRIADQSTTSVDLASFAAEQVLRSKPEWRESIDAVLFCTQTGDHIIPPSACVVHDRLGLRQDCLSTDITHGCPSFAIGLSIAKALVESGARNRVLLINADTLTKLVHPKDRSLVPLHGDGAAVTVVAASTGDGAIGSIAHGTDGAGHRFLMVPASGARTPRSAATAEEQTDDSGNVRTDEHLQMDGAAVFHFSLQTVPPAITAFLAEQSIDIGAYKRILFHQANKMMLDGIYDRIGATDDQRFFFLEKVGNTSAASLPMAIAQALRVGSVGSGDRMLFAAFGVGLAWGIGDLTFGPLLDTSAAETEYS